MKTFQNSEHYTYSGKAYRPSKGLTIHKCYAIAQLCVETPVLADHKFLKAPMGRGPDFHLLDFVALCPW